MTSKTPKNSTVKKMAEIIKSAWMDKRLDDDVVHVKAAERIMKMLNSLVKK